MPRELSVTIENEQNGLSVKAVLTSVLRLSRHEISRLKFTENGITLNGRQVRTNQTVSAGDILSVCFPEKPQEAASASFVPEILYEDEDMVIVNKPAGIVSHPSHGHPEDDMGTALRAYLKDRAAAVRTVGRLDKDVSGIVVYAKNQPACARLSAQRNSGVLRKTYLAAAEGIMEQPEGTIRCFLGRTEGQKARGITENGKECVTDYRLLETCGEVSLLEVTIRTGRTHQIRASFASAGHPLAGDALYGGSTERIARPALHCAFLRCRQPFTGEEITVSVPLPEDIRQLCKV